MIDALASESDILDWKPKMPVPVLPGVDKVRIEGLPDHGHQFPEQPVIRVPSQYASFQEKSVILQPEIDNRL